MDYTYKLETTANSFLTLEDIFNKDGINVFYILCYHVTTDAKYPFLQFLIDKTPFCNGLIKENFTLPYVMFSDLTNSIENLVLNRVKSALMSINCDPSKVESEMYKGILYDKYDTPYALINITDINISGLQLSRDSVSWFVLPSEIINNQTILNIELDQQVVELFLSVPDLGLLINSQTNEPFNIPDVVYTGSEYKNTQFHSIFGESKQKPYDNCGYYYFFYRTLEDAIKDGGWIKEGGDKKINKDDSSLTHHSSGRLLVEKEKEKENGNEYGRYISGGITRYALFIEGKMHLEPNSTFSLTDDIIKSMYSEPSITICYSGEHEIKPDVLVKEYNSFFPLSYHLLNKSLLDANYSPRLRNSKKIWIQ